MNDGNNKEMKEEKNNRTEKENTWKDENNRERKDNANKKIKSKKKVGRITLLIVAFVLSYEIIGMMVPFVHLKGVSTQFQQQFQVDQFYSEKEGVDRAYIVEDSVQALDERIRIIEKAEKSIILSTFDMREGQSTNDILSALLSAADRGVEVRLLVDGLSGMVRIKNSDLFRAVASYPNIEMRLYNPIHITQPWTFHGRMHDKYVIIDDTYYLLGGRNTFDYFLGDYIDENKSLDREVFIWNTASGTEETTNSSIHSLTDYFYQVWDSKYCTTFCDDETIQKEEKIKEKINTLKAHYKTLKEEKSELFDKEYAYEDITFPTDKVSLVSNPIHTGGKEPTVWYSLQQLMVHANDKVVIHTPYAVLSKDMYAGMTEIGQQNISFQLLTNSVENGDNFFGSSDYIQNKEKVINTGVEIYEYDGGHSYHGKSILIDDTISIIGSYNLDLRSTYVDTELMVVIDSKQLNRKLQENFDVIKKDTRKVLDTSSYEVPEHIILAEVPMWKRLAWKIVGVVMKPFRVLV